MKYALAVAGGAAALALIVMLTGGDDQSWFKMAILLGAMILLFVFATLVGARTKAVEYAGIALMFTIVICFMIFVASFTYKAVGKEAVNEIFSGDCDKLSGGWYSKGNDVTLTINQVGCSIEAYFLVRTGTVKSVGKWDSSRKLFVVNNKYTTFDGCTAYYDLTAALDGKHRFKTKENLPAGQCGSGPDTYGELTYEKISDL